MLNNFLKYNANVHEQPYQWRVFLLAKIVACFVIGKSNPTSIRFLEAILQTPFPKQSKKLSGCAI